jgi:hypothetical protein
MAQQIEKQYVQYSYDKNYGQGIISELGYLPKHDVDPDVRKGRTFQQSEIKRLSKISHRPSVHLTPPKEPAN